MDGPVVPVWVWRLLDQPSAPNGGGYHLFAKGSSYWSVQTTTWGSGGPGSGWWKNPILGVWSLHSLNP